MSERTERVRPLAADTFVELVLTLYRLESSNGPQQRHDVPNPTVHSAGEPSHRIEGTLSGADSSRNEGVGAHNEPAYRTPCPNVFEIRYVLVTETRSNSVTRATVREVSGFSPRVYVCLTYA